METILSIEITGLRIFGKHGVYHEESMVENEFELDVVLRYFPPSQINSLDQTIDYLKALEVVKKRFAQPSALLESLVIGMSEELKQSFPEITSLEISVKKIHPPIPSFTGSVGIRYSKNFPVS